MPKKFYNLFVTSLFLVFAFNYSAYAAKGMDEQSLKAALQKVLKRTQSMQNQVNSLQAEVRYLKTQLKKQKRPSAKMVRQYSQPRFNGKPGTTTPHTTQEGLPEQQMTPQPIRTNRRELDRNILSTAWFLGGTPVFTSPYLGQHSEYDGSDLISQAPSVNLDLRLLQQTKAMEQYLIEHKLPVPDHPLIELSGKVEALFSSVKETRRADSGGILSNLDLTTAELDVFAKVNPWGFGYIALDYDGNGPSAIRTDATNSRIYLRQGLITIGNLNRSPLYMTMGQMFVPFGQYGSFMLSTPVTLIEGRTRERAVNFGIHPAEGFYANGYVYKGDTKPDNGGRTQGGGTLGYKYDGTKFHADLKAGVISNLADSVGMQDTGAPSNIGFAGFGTTTEQNIIDNRDPENIRHSVPGLNLDGKLIYDKFVWIFEYVTALRRFDVHDLASGRGINGQVPVLKDLHGARPQTFHTELGYLFNIHGKPANVAVGYGWSSDAIPLLISHHSYMAVFNISLWRDTLQSLEFRYDDNYSQNQFGSGAGSVPFRPLDRHTATLLAQFGVYF